MYIGIIYNDKGICERNYLYTLEEMTRLDCDTMVAAVAADGQLVDGPSFAANKTSLARLLKNDDDVRAFLSGKWNSPDTNDPDWGSDKVLENWTWKNDADNNFYFAGHSPTMENALAKYNLPADPFAPAAINEEDSLIQIGAEGFACEECGETLHATDLIAECPHCGAIFCKKCVVDGSFEEHCNNCTL